MRATKKPRGRPKAEPGRDLRADLLKTSRQLLDEGGPAALSMREVARRAGCTHQAPYHYFEDRESILAALVCDGFDELTRHLLLANERARLENARAALVASGLAYVGFAVSHPGVFRIMFRPDMCNPARFPEIVQASARAHEALDQLNRIVHGRRATPALATILWAHVHGMSCLLLDGPLAAGFSSHKQRLAFLTEVTEKFADQVLGS